MSWLLTEPFLSVIGGGLAAAIVTAAFSIWWDVKKQKLEEDWQFRRYQANVIHACIVGIMEAYFSAKSEMLYITGTLESLLVSLNGLSSQADAIVRQQGGPDLTVAQLEARKSQLLQPFQTYNQQQVNLRWNQYEQKAKENHAKAELHLTALRPLISMDLYDELLVVFHKLSASFVWDLPHGKEKLKTLEDALPEVLQLRDKLMHELELVLGRKRRH
jgi:hypothetical protein